MMTRLGARKDSVDVAVARAVLRRERSGRWSALGTAYGILLVVVMVGSVALTAFARALSDVSVSGGVAGVPWLIAAALGAGVLRGCSAAGPAHADRATSRWLVPTPLPRRLVVRSRLRLMAGLASMAGAVGGVVVAVLTHPAHLAWPLVGVGALVGVLVGAAAWVAALWGQTRGLGSWMAWGCDAVVLVCCVTAVVCLRGDVGGLRMPGASDARFAWGAAVAMGCASLALIVVGALCSGRWVDHLRAGDLARAGATVEAVTGSVVMLDGEMLSLRRDARRLVAHRGRATSRPSLGRPAVVDVVVRDVRGCTRRGRDVLAAMAPVLLACLVAELFGPTAGVAALAVAAWCAASRAGEGLGVWLGSTSLWRIFPAPLVQVTAALLVAPAVAAGVVLAVGAVGAVVAGLSYMSVIAVGTGILAGLLRRSRRPEMTLGPMIDMGPALGQVPVGVVRRLVCGPDVVALVVAIGVGGGTMSWVAATVVGLVLLGWCLARSEPGA